VALAPTTPALSGARLPYLAAGYGFFAMVTGTNMAAPLYGVYAREFGFSPLVLMLIFTTYIAVLLPSLLLFGPLSDAVGRRWVIVAGLLLAAGATAIFLAAESVAWLFAARVVQGVGVGLCSGALTAALVETQPHGDRRHASLVATLALSIGAAPGLLLAGFLAEWAPWPLRLCFCSLLAIVACVLTFGLVRRTLPAAVPI
jgi:MFS family permease